VIVDTVEHGIGGAIDWKVTDRITTNIFGEYARLMGSAEDSSLVREWGSRDKFTVGVSAAWREMVPLKSAFAPVDITIPSTSAWRANKSVPHFAGAMHDYGQAANVLSRRFW
jgi:hypothetical protein